MAYDEGLAERVREIIGARQGVSEKMMFGSRAFLVNGYLAVAARTEDLLVRLSREDGDAAIGEPGVAAFAPYENRPRMPGWVVVDVGEDDAELARWVDAGADFASSLPPK